MTIFGFPGYVPGGQFAFPRPYVKQITFGFGAGAIFAQTDEQFFITDGTNPSVHIVCNFTPGLFASNSNRYTLDHLVIDWYALIDPSPVPIPVNFELRYWQGAALNGPGLLLRLAGWTDLYSFPLPPPPPDYWTPY